MTNANSKINASAISIKALFVLAFQLAFPAEKLKCKNAEKQASEEMN
jgi:hypothetical protein